MRAMRGVVIGVGLAMSGCVAPSLYHTYSPSPNGGTSNAGVSLGLGVESLQQVNDVEATTIQFPYSEGWIAMAAGDRGQAELRVSPYMSWLSFRYDLLPASGDTNVGFALAPAAGLSFGRQQTTDSQGGQTEELTQSYFIVSPGLTAIFLFLEGKAFVAPRFAYFNYQATNDSSLMSGSESETLTFYSVGMVAGYTMTGERLNYSFGVSAQRIESLEKDADGINVQIVPYITISLAAKKKEDQMDFPDQVDN